jgi:hypothetical protein
MTPFELASILITAILAAAALNYFVIKLSIKSALSDFLEKLNGTYKRSNECALIHKNVDDSLKDVQKDQVRLEKYAHQRMHEIANAAHVRLMQLEEER